MKFRLLGRKLRLTVQFIFGIFLIWSLPSESVGAAEAGGETLLLRMPAISQNHIAFVYAGDIWLADRNGESPRRLTVHPGVESDPEFSPDGNWIAFTGNYEGNADVYVVSVAGGQPRRLTYHPGNDRVRGWSGDGAFVMFTSPRNLRFERGGQLFTVGVDGGTVRQLPMPVAWDGAFSADGSRIAYQPFNPAYSGASGWKRYRGGTTPPIWLFDMTSHEIERMPHDRVNDTDPMWINGTVYFLSDRDRIVNVYAYEPGSGNVRKLTNAAQWDIRWANAGGDAIIYQMGGRLYILDLESGTSRAVPISIHPDLPETRGHWVAGAAFIQTADISPTGKRAVFSARGDIVTVPAEKGDIRNLTNSTSVHERNPLWSPGGTEIAYLSDSSGEYELVIADQTGGEKRRFSLGNPAFYFLRTWSPDASRIIFEDNHLNIYSIDSASGEITYLDAHARGFGAGSGEFAFSPDGRLLAYARSTVNYMRALTVHDFETGESFELTAGMSEARSPVFSRDGKYLYFTASTNFGPRSAGLDMSSQERPTRRGIYAAVISPDDPTPLPEQSDEEESRAKDVEKGLAAASDDVDQDAVKQAGQAGETEKTTAADLDLAGLRNRIIALPIAERDYTGLAVAKDGSLLYQENQQPGITIEPPAAAGQATGIIRRFSFDSRKDEVVQKGVLGFVVSADGGKMLVAGANRRWQVLPTTGTSKGNGNGNGALALSDMRIYVEPKAEWRQMYDEYWRLMRDMFYDPGMHGADWQAVYDKYLPLVEHVGRREDLSYIMIDMQGELVVSHARIFSGDFVQTKGADTGLLGADFSLENGRYRIARVYTGESWNPFLQAPLNVPGSIVSEGDYILAINGRELSAEDNIYALLEGTVGKEIVLLVNDSADRDGARQVTVKPIANERQIRRWAWVEENRRMVDEATGGRVGYMYLPNTAGAGYAYFNRYFYSQLDKEAFIIDERGNGGGQAANYIVDQLTRTYLSSFKLRDGALLDVPVGGVFGPKVMLIDMFAGSGGDFLPWDFKRRGGGILIGTRTWGGLVGGGPGPALMDGGLVNIPTIGFIHPDGYWAIENEGVAPDIEVEWIPKLVIAGHDPQLERAIVEILAALEDYVPIKIDNPPPYPTSSRN